MIKLGYNLKFILGNHEDMLLEDLENDYPLRRETEYSIYRNSRYFEKKSMEEWHKENFFSEVKWLIKWLKGCPIIICGNENIFVHAGLDLQRSLEDQGRGNVLWTREEFWLNEDSMLEEYKNKNIYFGHTPNINGRISKKTSKIYDIDCGAFFTHFLGCIEIIRTKEISNIKEMYIYKDEHIDFPEVSEKVFLTLWNEEIAPFINSEKYKIKKGKVLILKKLDRKEKKIITEFFKKYKKMFGKNILSYIKNDFKINIFFK